VLSVTTDRIIVSRTDAIGDVVLTLPMLGKLRQRYPSSEILFLGRSYTRPIVECCEHVDGFLVWDEVAESDRRTRSDFLRARNADVIVHVYPRHAIAAAARRARIPNRIGTSHRFYHLWTCNRLVGLSRRKSPLHESQLNVKLLEPLGLETIPGLDEIPALYGLTRVPTLRPELAALLANDRLNLIVHPMTGGSSKRWSLENYDRLIRALPLEKCAIFVTGTEADGEAIADALPLEKSNVTSLVGRLALSDLVSFIGSADALVCGSTGPLHVAAALGKCAIGFYMPIGIAHPRRYGPVGADVHPLLYDPDCHRCRDGLDCGCLQSIPTSAVLEILEPLADSITSSRRG
jgi:ADP-heptose:LPS heptosyltransferase